MHDDWDVPERVEPTLKAAPKVRQLYWCDFPRDAQLPELWKRRPVIVLSFRNTLYGAVTVIPCSTASQTDTKATFRLKTSIDGREAWAICDKPTTVAVSRLVQHKTGIMRLPEDEFSALLGVVYSLLPRLAPDT
jgi:mRNA interferase MazF